jgi:hypothetical protein
MRNAVGVDPAGTKGKRHGLPREICICLDEPDYGGGNDVGRVQGSQED